MLNRSAWMNCAYPTCSRYLEMKAKAAEQMERELAEDEEKETAQGHWRAVAIKAGVLKEAPAARLTKVLTHAERALKQKAAQLAQQEKIAAAQVCQWLTSPLLVAGLEARLSWRTLAFLCSHLTPRHESPRIDACTALYRS